MRPKELKEIKKLIGSEKAKEFKKDSLIAIEEFLKGNKPNLSMDVLIPGKPDYICGVSVSLHSDGEYTITYAEQGKNIIYMPYTTPENAVNYPYFKGRNIYEVINDDKTLVDVRVINSFFWNLVYYL